MQTRKSEGPKSQLRRPQPKIKNQKSKIKNSPLDWRHNGKVARLPKALRDKINLMIQDGLSYPAIIKSLGDSGKHLTVLNLSRWRRGGYKDWLLEQSWLADIRTRQESAADLTSDFAPPSFNSARHGEESCGVGAKRLKAPGIAAADAYATIMRVSIKKSKIKNSELACLRLTLCYSWPE